MWSIASSANHVGHPSPTESKEEPNRCSLVLVIYMRNPIISSWNPPISWDTQVIWKESRVWRTTVNILSRYVHGDITW